FLHAAVGGVLGAPRLHRTVVEGDIISKEEAGEYALAAFGDRWGPVIDEALAYWRGQLTAGPFRPVGRRRREAARFVLVGGGGATTRLGSGGRPRRRAPEARLRPR